MKSLPNLLSLLRMVGSGSLLICDVTGSAFWVIFCLCGISDMADGWLARRLHATTKTGALLDSLADICFVACCAWRLLPFLKLPLWLWIWAAVIVVIKMVNQVSALVKHGKCCFPHTIANKVTGLLLFLAVPLTFWSNVPITIVAVVATIAAIHEGQVLKKNLK